MSIPHLSAARRDASGRQLNHNRSSFLNFHSLKIGFTLVEMLAVIAIIGLLTALAVPSLPSLLGTKGISKAVNDTSGILEMARTEAMARQTYVWVSFFNRDVGGDKELLIGAVSSLDGSGRTRDPLTGAINYRPLTKVVKIANLVCSASVPGNVGKLAPSAAFITSAGPGFRIGNVDFPASSAAPTVIFSPNGEILQSANDMRFISKVDVGLVPTKGSFIESNGNDGAIVRVLGGSGRVQIFRP